MFQEAGGEVCSNITQATEGGTAIKRIDGMTQEELDINERREADGNKLLAEGVVGCVALIAQRVSNNMIAILQMPSY